VFLGVQILTPFFSLTLPDFVFFFMSLETKFSEDFKTVLRNTIRLLNVGFRGDFVPDCLDKLCFREFKF